MKYKMSFAKYLFVKFWGNGIKRNRKKILPYRGFRLSKLLEPLMFLSFSQILLQFLYSKLLQFEVFKVIMI